MNDVSSEVTARRLGISRQAVSAARKLALDNIRRKLRARGFTMNDGGILAAGRRATGNALPSADGEGSIDGMSDLQRAATQHNRNSPAGGLSEAAPRLAANGQPSNLTAAEYARATSPEFKARYGDWEAVANAKLPRNANSYAKARETLGALRGREFENSRSGLRATLTRSGIEKILSGKAAHKSDSVGAHMFAAVNIDKLFERGVVLAAEKGNKGGVLVSHKIYAPFFFKGKTLVAKVTVQELSPKDGNRLYSVEALDIEKPEGNLAPANLAETSVAPTPAYLQDKLRQISDSVNPANIKILLDENGEPVMSAATAGGLSEAEFWQQAAMPLDITTLAEARQQARHLVGRPLTNTATGMAATVSNNSVSKMTSGSAVKKSGSLTAHALAVANLDTLFKNAEMVETGADRDNNPDITAIHRFYAPMNVAGEIYAAKLTVKSLASQEQGNRIYTVEALDIAKPDIKRVEPAKNNLATSIQYAGFIDKLRPRQDIVNGKNELPDSSRPTDGTLGAGRRARPSKDENPFLTELNELTGGLLDDIPTQQEVEDLQRRARAEETGRRTIGRADRASYGKDDATRRNVDAIRDLHDQRLQRETVQEWQEKARKMLADDLDGVKRKILNKALRPESAGSYTDEEVEAAKMLLPYLMQRAIRSGDRAAIREVQLLVWGDANGRTDTARAMRAMADSHRTKTQRNMEFLTKTAFTPSAAERNRINNITNPDERLRELDKIQGRRLAKIEAALNAMGVTLEDIFAGEAAVAMKSTTIVQNALSQLNTPVERKVMRLSFDGFPSGDIARENKISADEVRRIQKKFQGLMDGIFDRFIDQGLTEKDFEAVDVSRLILGAAMRSGSAATLSGREREAIKERLRKQFANVYDFSRNDAKNRTATRRRKPRRRQAASGVTGALFNDAPVPADGERKQDVLVYGDAALPPKLQRLLNRVVKPSGDAVPWEELRQEQLEYDQYQPWEYVPFDAGNTDDVIRVGRVMQAAGGNMTDMLLEGWINGILSGPATHVANITGNLTNTAWEYLLQRPLEALINSVAGVKDAATFGELLTVLNGVRGGLVAGAAAAVRAFRGGHDFFKGDVLDPQLTIDGIDKLGNVRAAIPGKTGEIIRIPGRALLAMDAFFKYSVGLVEAGAQAYRLGRAQGLSGAELEKYIRAQTNTPGSAAWQRAVDKAEELTFQTPFKSDGAEGLIKKFGQLRNTGNWATRMLVTMLFPFIRTPYRIFETGTRKSPLGSLAVAARLAKGLYAMKNGKPFIEGYSQAQMVKDLAEQTIAWATMALLYAATEGDPDDDDKLLLFTVPHPYGIDQQGERDLSNRMYGGSYQVRIGGRNGVHFNYGRIEPIATLLGTVTSAIASLKRDKDKNTVERIVNLPLRMLPAFVANVQDKTFLQGFSNLIDLMDSAKQIKDKELAVTDAAGKLVRRQVSSMVPNILRQPIRNFDDYLRDSKYAGNGYQLLPLPSLAEQRYDLYGRPLTKGNHSLTRLFFPAGTEPHATLTLGDRLLTSWNRNPDHKSYFPERPTRTTYKFKLRDGTYQDMTPGQIATFDKLAGQYFTRDLQRWLTPEIARHPTERDVERFRDSLSEARRKAKEEMARRKNLKFQTPNSK
jgi:hypothetical protein